MKKEDVYSAITEELIATPEKLEKFLDAFGQMGSWYLFQLMKENRAEVERLEKKVIGQNHQIADLELAVRKLQTAVKRLST